jgi:hypothetical protein
VIPLVLVMVTLVVASSVLLVSPLVEEVSVDELGQVDVVSDHGGLAPRVVLMGGVLLRDVKRSEDLDQVAGWLSIVDDIIPVASALEAGYVG